MEKSYQRLYDFVSSIRVLCTLIAIFYVMYWFLHTIQFPFIQYAGIIFNPLVDILKNFISWTIDYKNFEIDMLPIIVAAGFQVAYFILQGPLDIIEKVEKKHKLNVIAEKKLEEKLMNENLKEVFVNKTLEYNAFAILLTLNLKTEVDTNLLSPEGNIDLKETAKKEYAKIVNIMREKYITCKVITPGKLFIIYDNFALFDDFLTDILSEIKKFSTQNSQNGIITEFSLVIDAFREGEKVSKILDIMEKILTFNYTNKALGTMSFNIRYRLNNQKNKYLLETIGISRFFEKPVDGVQNYTDFELFNLKIAKK